MGKQKNSFEADEMDFDDDTDLVGEIDIDELVEIIHQADRYDPRTRGRRFRSARRQLDDMAISRSLKKQLSDWDEDDDFDFYEH